jgi:hypothetical protein
MESVASYTINEQQKRPRWNKSEERRPPRTYEQSYLCEKHILSYTNACGALGSFENLSPERLSNLFRLLRFGRGITNGKEEFHVGFVARDLIDTPIVLSFVPEQDLCDIFLHRFVSSEIVREHNKLNSSRLTQLMRTTKKHSLLDPQLSSLQ